MNMTMPATSNNKQEWALYYASLGFSIIPLCTPTGMGSCAIHGDGCKSAGKTPLIKWEKYKSERASVVTLNEWWGKWPNANIGIVTGAVSNVVVVDVEHGGNCDGLIPTVMSKTGGGGWHYYYKYPGQKIGNSVRIKELIDIRGDGGYVVAPPSLHRSGQVYQWNVAPSEGSYVSAPLWVLNKPKTNVERGGTVLKGVSKGSRNQSAASVVGKFISNFPESDWEEIVWPALVGWNKQNTPPLDEAELKSVYESIVKKEKSLVKDKGDLQTRTIASQLVKLVTEAGIRLFNDQLRDPYIATFGDGRQVLKLGSKQFKLWLTGFVWEKWHKSVNSEVMQAVSQVLESMAIFDSEQIQLSVRVAWHENALWYDLGGGSAVKVDSAGWVVVTQPPILFRCMNHQKNHPLPVLGGNIDSLLSFANIQEKNEQLLLKVFLITAFIPGFPHPALVLHGSQGAAKTTLCRLIKNLVDPSRIATMSIPKNVTEFVQLASHHWTIFFDNLSYLPEWLSDSISRAITGDGFSKRELFTDDEDKIYQFHTVIGLNGISLVVDKPDLLDRSILLNLARIPESKRLTEKDVQQKFYNELPGILGAIFTSLSLSLAQIKNVSLRNLPRMADFAQWGCAVATSLGHTESEFLNAYGSNIGQQNNEAIDASPIAGPILTFMEQKNDWEGNATELYTALQSIAESSSVDTKGKFWPKGARALWHRIESIIPNLEAVGLKFSRDHNGHKRLIKIWHFNKDITMIDNIDKQDPLINQSALVCPKKI